MKISASQKTGFDLLLKATEGLSKEHRAYVLATAWHETAQTMQPIRERGNAKYFAKYEAGTPIGRRLGNTIIGDGVKFIGRGFCQITGRANYAKFSKLLGVDLVANPDLALQADIAAKIIVIGMTRGEFTGKAMSDYKSFKDMRRVVNGMDCAAKIAGYAQEFMALIPDAPAKAPEKPVQPVPAPVAPLPMPEFKTAPVMPPEPRKGLFAVLASLFKRKQP